MKEGNFIYDLLSGNEGDARSRILAAALEEFALRSADAARTRTIAAKAHVNHAAISYYFGGKSELYMEVVRHIADYIQYYSAPYFERGEAIFKSKDADDARKLILDFTMSRLCLEDDNSEKLRWIILMITREEMCATKVFETFYKKAIMPASNLLNGLVEIASKGKLNKIEAKIVSEMIMGQVHIFNSMRTGFKRVNGWSKFGEREFADVSNILKVMLDKFFK